MTSIRGPLQLVTVILVMVTLAYHCQADHRADRMRLMAAVEAPRRPNNFADLKELNKYLEDLRQYYTLIGRPRFGRSTRSFSEEAMKSNLS